MLMKTAISGKRLPKLLAQRSGSGNLIGKEKRSEHEYQ